MTFILWQFVEEEGLGHVVVFFFFFQCLVLIKLEQCNLHLGCMLYFVCRMTTPGARNILRWEATILYYSTITT